jgi:hypothetical protein
MRARPIILMKAILSKNKCEIIKAKLIARTSLSAKI